MLVCEITGVQLITCISNIGLKMQFLFAMLLYDICTCTEFIFKIGMTNYTEYLQGLVYMTLFMIHVLCLLKDKMTLV